MGIKSGRSASYYFALWSISAKLVMDFFVPARDLNFFVFNGLLVALFLLLRPRLYLGRRGVALFVVASTFFAALALKDGGNSIIFKIASLPVLVVVFFSIGRGLSEAAVKRLFKILFVEFIVCFLLNYVLSVATGLIRSREFWNFEHANLLGSYVLVMLVPTSYLLYQLSNSKGRIIGFVLVLMAYLSTSTGAFLLSLSVFFKAKNLAFKNIMIILLSIIFVIIAGLALLSIADPMTYDKIAAPFKLINSGGWDRLVGEARNGGGITYLAADQQGSFTWRAYAYLVYGFFIAGETWDRFIFGNGVGGYEIVWGGAMPHNDFILILTDFGFLFFIVWVSFCGWLLVKVWREYPQWFAVVVAFIFRLLCENNIYSYYVASIGCVIFSLIFGAITRASRERGAVRAQASRAVA